MPKQLVNIGSAQEHILIGTKAEFIKLQAKHAVVGKDSAAIAKAVEKIEKLPDRVSALPNYVAPHRELMTAVKALKATYATKHPKFIQAVETGFVAPVDDVVGKISQNLGAIKDLPHQFTEAADFIDKASKVLSKPLDAQRLKTAIDRITGAGSLFTNGQNSASLLHQDFGVELFDKVAKLAQTERHRFEEINKFLTAALKSQNFGVNVGPVMISLIHLHDLCKKLAASLASAKI